MSTKNLHVKRERKRERENLQMKIFNGQRKNDFFLVNIQLVIDNTFSLFALFYY